MDTGLRMLSLPGARSCLWAPYGVTSGWAQQSQHSQDLGAEWDPWAASTRALGSSGEGSTRGGGLSL